jgi:hypothetical protein
MFEIVEEVTKGFVNIILGFFSQMHLRAFYDRYLNKGGGQSQE